MLRNWIKRLTAWLETFADEGKRDMSEISSEVAAVADGGLQAVERVVTTAVSDVETIVRDGTSIAEEAASKVLTEVAPKAVSVAGVDPVLGKIKDLLDGSQQSVACWPEVTALAKALDSDADTVVAKVKQLVDYAGQPPKAWDEIVVLAKKLAAG